MKNLIPPNIKLLAPLLLAIIGIVVAGVVIFRISFAQIALQNQRIKESKEERNALTQKVAILSEVEENILPAADLSLIVIPSTNSSLAAISQIKALANEKVVVITNLSVGSGGSENLLKKASVNFDVEGPTPSILDFLTTVNTTAPTMLVDEMALNNETGIATAHVSIATYWATLPTTIPGISESVSSLSEEEMNTLQVFTTLRSPVFSNLTPQEAQLRENPFN